MKPLNIKEGDIIKFSHRGQMVAGQVIYVTDYDTINVVPFDLKFVWSIQRNKVGGVLKLGDPTITVEQLENFMDGVYLMLQIEDGLPTMVNTPPSPTVH